MATKGLTWRELQERKQNLQCNGETAKVNMPRDDKYAVQPTPDPLTDAERAQVDAFRAECQAVNPLEAIRQIDVAFGAWFCEHADSKADDEFAGRMIVILEAVLGKTSADKAFDADARNEAAK